MTTQTGALRSKTRTCKRLRAVPCARAAAKHTFEYDRANRLSHATLGQSFVFDEGALGSTPVLLGEYGNGGNSARPLEYIWLPLEGMQAQLVAVRLGVGSGRLLSVHTDPLGTPRQLREGYAPNTVQWQWPFSPFGETPPSGALQTVTQTVNGTSSTRYKATEPAERLNLRFPGQYFDQKTNLNYNLMRSYDSGGGRYTQADPIGLNGGPNRYLYANGDPLRLVDPMGLDPWGKENPDPWYPGTKAPPFQCRPDGNPWGWGCGDKDTDRRVPDVVGGVNMIPACRTHDACYDNASKPGASKTQCDTQFRSNIYELCRQAGRSDFYCRNLSYSYFKGVDIGGGDAWNNAKKARP